VVVRWLRLCIEGMKGPHGDLGWHSDKCHRRSSLDIKEQTSTKCALPFSFRKIRADCDLPISAPILADADFRLDAFSTKLFPGISSSVKAHNGFQEAHRR